MNKSISLALADTNLLQWMKEIRRTVHQYPELGFQEKRTSTYIQEKLTELQIPFRSNVGKTGVVATITGNQQGCGHVALRADMDGLPIQDEKQVSYASKLPNVMHGCGHDGHIAMLLGAAVLLKKKTFPGKVSLIFQPAEEHGNGAQKIIEEGILNGVDVIFAGHIDTHFQTGVITVDEGVICSCADPFTISIRGKGGHGARPHETRDALVAGAYLVTALQPLISRETDPNASAVLTVGRFTSGQAHNVIACEATIDGTLRSNDCEIRKKMLHGLQRVCDSIAKQFEVIITISFLDGLPAVVNDSNSAHVARQAAQMVAGIQHVVSQGRASLGGEDFAFYQQHIPGCMVRFGANPPDESSPSHSNTFDFDENVLSVGAEWLATVALQWLMVCEHDN